MGSRTSSQRWTQNCSHLRKPQITVPTQHCDYCGLPIPKPLWLGSSVGESESNAGLHYCCSGCQFAHAITKETGEEGATRWTLTKLGIAIFFAMNVMVFTLALWAYNNPDVSGGSQMAEMFADLFRFACLILSLPVLFLLGRPLLENAIEQLQARIFSTDLLLMTGVIAAYGYSIFSVWRGSGDIYFEVGCMILVMVTLGRWLEATGKLQSTKALDQLEQLLPNEVTRLRNGNREIISRDEIERHDQLAVPAGERIPADGVLASSSATVDEQLVTGESWPAEKTQGDALTGGTLNLDGELILVVSAKPDEGTLARLIEAAREARDQQGRYQQLADRISQWFIPVMVLIAVMTLAVHTWRADLATGMLTALSVVLVACPCALGLATPMALWAAMGTAARRGILFRSPSALERLAQIKALRFDKTGTLTTGEPTVDVLHVDQSISRDEVLRRANALAATSTHVFSQAIRRFARESDETGLPSDVPVQSLAGRGLEAHLFGENTPTLLGNKRLMDERDFACSAELESEILQALQQGIPTVLIGWNRHVRGVFCLQEQLRDDVEQLITACREEGLDLGILTGDHKQSAERIADQIGMPVWSELTPEGKSEAVLELARTVGPVGLVGDGINDAPALAHAAVGISMGCGADVARDSADICLVGDDLSQIPWLINLARRTLSTIRMNLFWAFGYNSVGIAVAAMGWLHPAFAALLMVASSVFVITNSLRLSESTHSFSGHELSTGQFQATLPVKAEAVA